MNEEYSARSPNETRLEEYRTIDYVLSLWYIGGATYLYMSMMSMGA